MAKRGKAREPRPRRRAEPGAPSARRGPDPAEVAKDYVRGSGVIEVEPVERPEQVDDPDDMATGTVQDQLVYQGLDENRMPPPADPRRRRKRSPVRERAAPASRASKVKSKR
jgi:hypothetical protein